jgi:ribonucleoside-diphosphate reductase alpha chain
LRHRAPVSEVIKVAKKIDDNISSFISAICRVLSKYVAKTEVKGEVCPDCGSKLQHEAGCVKCTNCTYSKCLFIYSPN